MSWTVIGYVHEETRDTGCVLIYRHAHTPRSHGRQHDRFTHNEDLIFFPEVGGLKKKICFLFVLFKYSFNLF